MGVMIMEDFSYIEVGQHYRPSCMYQYTKKGEYKAKRMDRIEGT
jgi:hypothetical protein